MGKSRLPQEVVDFINIELGAAKPQPFSIIAKLIAQRYGIRVSKGTISKRAKAFNTEFRRGRKQVSPAGRKREPGIPLKAAGAFFLKGAELETGVLPTINRLFKAKDASIKARRAVLLAQKINAFLLYAPLFDLQAAERISASQRRALAYLSGPAKELPKDGEIRQYLQYLSEQKMLPTINKEVMNASSEARSIRIQFADQTFYLDAQLQTVWSKPDLPGYFSTSLYRAKGYVKSIFIAPSAQRPLILRAAPGYTYLPPEAFNLIRCFEQAKDKPITQVAILGCCGETLASWSNLKPPGRCYFILPLNQWQYVRLQGTEIVKPFKQFRIGIEHEQMSVADARIKLFGSQLSENIEVRAAMLGRKSERTALMTNISSRQERYIRKITQLYFCRWPQATIPTYYDLLELAHEDELGRKQKESYITTLTAIGYKQKPVSISPQDSLNIFRPWLEHLHQYCLRRFFPSEYAQEGFLAMRAKLYQQAGYLKIKQDCWEVFLPPLSPEKTQKAIRFACQKFNQSGLRIPAQKDLRIYLQGHK